MIEITKTSLLSFPGVTGVAVTMVIAISAMSKPSDIVESTLKAAGSNKD